MSRSQALSSFGAASLQHQAAILTGHSRAKAMRLRASSVVWLEGPLGHRMSSPYKTKTLRLAAACVYVKKRNPPNHALSVIL